LFLNVLWPDIPDHARLLVWTLPDRRSRWYRSAVEAEEAARVCSENGQNAYFGVGLADYAAVEARAQQHGRTTENVRAESAEVCGLYGPAADLDVVSAGHRKHALFASVELAQQFLDALPLPASAVVRTGGGLQAHWIFKEPWFFESDGERRAAEAISRGWSSFLRGLARRQGCEIDATWDLARVLRVPGTTNHKYPAAVELTALSEVRYNASDFEPWRQEGPAVGYETGELVLDPNASPPVDKLTALEQIEPRVRLTLYHERRDLADSSPSAYDQSLANFAAAAGWTDQEIADLISMHRRLARAKPKLRQDYYRRTIAKARGEAAASILEDDALHVSSTEAPARRAELLSVVQAKTGIPVQRILLYGQDSTQQFCLVLDDGDTVLLGSVRDFTQRARWEEAAVLAGCTAFTRPSNRDWPAVKAAAIAAFETVEIPEVMPEELMRTWLQLIRPAAYQVNGSEQRFQVIKDGMPYVSDGQFHFRSESLLEALWQKRERIDRVDLHRRLRQLGWSSRDQSARSGNDVCHKRYFEVSLDWLSGPTREESEKTPEIS
jgi:hypothetical protein